ncbi:nucleoside transporter [Chitinophaga skermanii]|uniref:Nucleoside transporter n=1 Tax=Chitinophaga skermanii TaxID=331697 RepID=A0A327R3G3_9BACT|nr:nucleoside permease [Chitinophaga skermanii]RAJ10598.1 nucleoside transporter [Chitinophaga skermanii]
MKALTRFQLSSMMFLEYFIWGAWYVTMSTYMKLYLGASPVQIGAAYSALAIATMISPFFVGMVADKYFSAQRVMSVLHILGAAILFLATKIESSNVFYWIILIYSLLYMPTIALSNTIAFHQLTDAGKQFPTIRVFGTVGWIVSGIVLSYFKIENTATTFILAGGASLLLGAMSYFLPHTPPQNTSKEKTTFAKAAGLDALVLLKDKSYFIFFIAAVLICIPLAFYYELANLFLNDKGMENASSKMILGQISEALFILAIPLLFHRIGVKKMLMLGMFAWVLRYVCFSFGDMQSNTWMLYAGIILHGICYDFFFVTGYMYTEAKAGEKIKNAAQGMFTFATYGLGMFIGTWLSGIIAHALITADGQYNWTPIWLVPSGVALLVIIYFILFFKEKHSNTIQNPQNS